MDKNKNTVSEPESVWGGNWTEKKLDVFKKYVQAYLTIMAKNPYWETIYFDGFAGSGNRKGKENVAVLRKLFSDDEINDSYKGAAERIVSLDLSFDYYYFIDTNLKSLKKLENKLKPYTEKKKILFRPGDCNHWLWELSDVMKREPERYAALVLLDPFGMQINWDSIASLQNTRTDIWILVPTGVIVNRLLDKKGELKHLEKLESFFGMNKEELKQYFYTEKKYNTIFGEQSIIRKVNNPIEKIAELYIKRLNDIWKFVTKKPLILRNRKNVALFHFVFASNNATALNISKQIIRGL